MIWLSFSASGNKAWAESVAVAKGQPAPFDGVLLDVDSANKAYQNAVNANRYKLLNDSLQNTVKLQDENFLLSEKKTELLLNQNLNLTKELSSVRTGTNWMLVIGFVSGVLLTGLAVYGASEAIKAAK